MSLVGNYAYTNIVERFELVKFYILDIMPFAQFCKNICVDELDIEKLQSTRPSAGNIREAKRTDAADKKVYSMNP